MSRPPRDPNDPKAIDEGTDTYDTIDWLLKNVPNNNGRVGMLGISYPGWLTVMALLDPHPALKAASPQASPADMFLGDDFHHNGAFRLSYGFEYVAMMETDKEQRQLRVRPLRHLRVVSEARRAVERQREVLQGQDADLERLRRASQLRRLLEEAGVGAVPEARHRADAATSPAGSTRKTSTARSRPTSCSRSTTRTNQNFLVVGPWNHGGWAARAGRQARQDRLRQRHRQALPREGAGAVLRPLPQGQGRRRPARSPDVPDRQQPVGEHDALAAEGRRDARSSTSTPNGKLAFEPPAATADGVRRVRLRSRQAGAVSAAADHADVSRRRSGRCGWSRTSASRTHRPDVLTLRDRAARRGRDRRRRR